ncbi:swi5-like zinc finger protein [Coemansia biformis]|uniref:Swi5-like zinc finger protein n=1 Tax=Coemansia biformis TaxID=1286918 RepID=A0A9W7Y8N5_9FUNG|nr:swi5-like zinc finger protein [Coemansia biformis]
MDGSPSKRGPGSAGAPSLVPDCASEQRTPFTAAPEDERKQALRAAVDALKNSLQAQAQARDALLGEAGLTVDQARALNDELIGRLHRYNDIKDAGQILFGKLAELKGKTVKEVYSDYSVGLND